MNKTYGLSLLDKYLTAKETVISLGFAKEIDWQSELSFSKVTVSDFLKEAAWVVLSSGMKESVISARFPDISRAFFYWQSPQKIIEERERCRVQALKIFGHSGKIDAIIEIARRVQAVGFENLKKTIETDGIEAIRSLPFMGPATSFHLAKNIGLNVVKPDRHLVRIAQKTGFSTPDEMCREISLAVGDALPVVDIVIWRYAALHSDYLDFFSFKTAGSSCSDSAEAN